jgi:two-component system sensor histidine kinase KdpD
MDELAHSNAPGSRHPKRWQDVEELLEAGIDVFTTVNVQHLESLNDVVSGVTGVQVRETVPDPFFDAADEVVLVDLPPDDLRQRLHEGKVYIGGQAERAIEHFFRKGNLIALRELALRRTADRVDDQMRAWRDRQGRKKSGIPATPSCCASATTPAAKSWSAPPPGWRPNWAASGMRCMSKPLPAPPAGKRRRAILAALRLAQELGAETATLSDPSEDKAILRYAREHNLGKIVIGRRKNAAGGRESFADKLARRAPDLDLVVVALDEKPSLPARASDSRPAMDKWRMQLQGCRWPWRCALSLPDCHAVADGL